MTDENGAAPCRSVICAFCHFTPQAAGANFPRSVLRPADLFARNQTSGARAKREKRRRVGDVAADGGGWRRRRRRRRRRPHSQRRPPLASRRSQSTRTRQRAHPSHTTRQIARGQRRRNQDAHDQTHTHTQPSLALNRPPASSLFCPASTRNARRAREDPGALCVLVAARLPGRAGPGQAQRSSAPPTRIMVLMSPNGGPSRCYHFFMDFLKVCLSFRASHRALDRCVRAGTLPAVAAAGEQRRLDRHSRPQKKHKNKKKSPHTVHRGQRRPPPGVQGVGRRLPRVPAPPPLPRAQARGGAGGAASAASGGVRGWRPPLKKGPLLPRTPQTPNERTPLLSLQGRLLLTFLV